jgi:DNA-directed RNA polymerase subunit RPC12/RpoP
MAKSSTKLISLLLTVCMLLCLFPTSVFASDSTDYMKIAMLDCGRKYFTVDWVKSLIYEAKADGYTHVMLAIGNDGMRFILDDMSLTVGSTTYTDDAVSSAIISGNNAYTTDSTGEWTESEMDEILSAAKSAGIEIIPLLNTPGHMDAILSAANSLTGTTCSYNSSSRTIDVTNTTAVAFTEAFVQKYIDYFAEKGCTYFNFGADEYANDRYTSGSMGFGNLQSSGKYGYYIKYVNEIAAMIKNAGMTPIAFNDGIEFANKTSAAVGSTTYTFDKDIVICYWSSGWSGYSPRSVSNLVSDGFKLINTTGDFYYVLGKSDNFDSGYTYASNWSNYKVCGTTVSSSSVVGGMFCMWSDYPGAETETQEASKIRLPLRALGLAMNGSYTSDMDTSVVSGGFNADGTLNTDPPAQVHNYQLTSSVAPTCTEEGSNTYTCSDCGESYTETVPAEGHNYTAEDDGGDTVYTCTKCGDSYTSLLPRENISLKVGETSEKYTLEGEKSVSVAGDSNIAQANITYTEGTGAEVSYSATASASASAYSTYYVSNLIDGNTSSFYWSDSSQTKGMYARVDLGADVLFDAIQITSPAHGDYCTNANVQISSDGSNWTTIGQYTGKSSSSVTSTYSVPDSIESFRYIQVIITTARNYWWQLSEIAWGSYDGSTFTRAAASGTVTTGTLTTTELTFTGIGAGTTSYVVDGTKYIIEVEADHVHSYAKTSETAPTCTTEGSIVYTCSECGDTYTESVPAAGHSYTSVVTEPTCTEDGYTTYTCSNCGDSYTGDTTPATGHSYTSVVTEPTCTEDGYTTYTCSVCGSSYTESVSAAGHNYVSVVTAPTCTEDGYTTYTCSVCGDSYVSDTTPAAGHSYTKAVSSATCTEDGTTTFTCTVCGDSYTETTPATGHNYVSVVTEPTCTEDGYTTYTCSNCGDSYTDDTTPATGHSYTSVVTAPTCTENGYTTYTCSVCGDSYTDDTTPATGHSYTSVVTAPTCTEDGYTTYTCSNCGDSYTGDTTPATGHSYTSVVTEPTCTEDGYTTYTCSNCGDSYTGDTTPAAGHSYTSVVTVPTCTEDGYTTYTCSVCGDSYTGDTTPAAGHSYECTEDGDVLVYTCTICGDTYSEEAIPTVKLKLNVGESYTFTADNADITDEADSNIASVSIKTNAGGYNAVSELTDGKYLIINNNSVLTTSSTTYYSSWDGAGTIYGLSATTYSSTGDFDDYLWTITEVDGGYTITSADGLYLTLVTSNVSSNLTLSEDEQIVSITDLGNQFAISYGSMYLDKYTSYFVASYPGVVNENEKWDLYKAEDASYEITITAVSDGTTSAVINGTKYVVDVHEHDYVSEITTEATCTDDGVITYTCSGCGDSYTEAIKAAGHDYSCTEEDGYYVYTCSVCGDSYSEEISTVSYEYVSSISSGNNYVVTVYSNGGYYALTHNGTTLGVAAVEVSDNEITSEVTEDMLWNYSNNRLSFVYNSTTYYIGKSWSSNITISTNGSSVSYSSNRLRISNYYLVYSGNSLYTSRRSSSSCYIYAEINN